MEVGGGREMVGDRSDGDEAEENMIGGSTRKDCLQLN